MGILIGALALLAEGIIGFWLMDGYHSSKYLRNHPEKKKAAVVPVSEKKERKFSKWHEFALFIVLPAVIVLIVRPSICLLWALLCIPLIASLDIGRQWAKEWRWPKWLQAAIALILTIAFCVSGYRSIDEATKPIFVYLRPGVAVFPPGSGVDWTLETMVRTNHPTYNIQIEIDDEVTGRALQTIKDQSRVEAMIRGSHVAKSFGEADPFENSDVLVDQVVWRPIDPTDQEYHFGASYRIGETVERISEELRVSGDHPSDRTKTKWAYAMRLKDDKGRLLVECKDANFPSSPEWPKNLSACFPDFRELHHAALTRCLYSRFSE